MTPDETDFDQLPEALRLALFERARQQLSAGKPEKLDLNLAQISEATAIGRGTVHNRYRIALLKLRAEVDKRDL